MLTALSVSSPLLLPLRRLRSHRCRQRAMATSSAAAADIGGVVASDPGTAYNLLLSCPFGLPRSHVHVNFSQLHDRIPHPDAILEESISEIWNRRLEKNPSLYNGTKFRYAGHSSQGTDKFDITSPVRLFLGLTDYRAFVGTNLNPMWEKFLVPSDDDSVHCRHMSNPLGNGAIVETSDQKILVLRRSHNVGEFPGYFVFPGGHSEPIEVGISSHQTGTNDCSRIDEGISHEMFDGMIREVVEEIGVPADTLGSRIGRGGKR